MIFSWGRRKQSLDERRTGTIVRTDDELLDSFKSDPWDQLTRADQVSVLQEMENRRALIQGRSPCKIVEINSNNLYGSYNDGTNRININFEDFSSYEILDTYIHESNHAYQHYCVANNCGYDYTTRSMLQAELAKDGFGNHYNYATQSLFYDLQYNELDSNNVAADFVISQYTRYNGDPQYADYIKERASHFSHVNSELDSLRSERASLQHDQAYTSFVRCDINGDQFEAIENRIQNSKTDDPMAQRSKSIDQKLQSLNANLISSHEKEDGNMPQSAFRSEPNMYQSVPSMQQAVDDSTYEERGHQKGGSIVDTKESLNQQYQEGVRSLQEAYPNYQTDPIEAATFIHEVQNMQEEMGITFSPPRYTPENETIATSSSLPNSSAAPQNAISQLDRSEENEERTFRGNAISRAVENNRQTASTDINKNAISRIVGKGEQSGHIHSPSNDVKENNYHQDNEITI